MRGGVLVLVVAITIVVTPRAAETERKSLIAEAPEKYARLRNPFAKDAESLTVGERIYTTKCARCHEQDERGEIRGPSLDVPTIKNAPPGALYWVLEKGSSEMPSFAKFPGKYRWQVVTYLQRP